MTVGTEMWMERNYVLEWFVLAFILNVDFYLFKAYCTTLPID